MFHICAIYKYACTHIIESWNYNRIALILGLIILNLAILFNKCLCHFIHLAMLKRLVINTFQLVPIKLEVFVFHVHFYAQLMYLLLMNIDLDEYVNWKHCHTNLYIFRVFLVRRFCFGNSEWKQNWLQNLKTAIHMEILQMKMNLQRNPSRHHQKTPWIPNRPHPSTPEPRKQERTAMIRVSRSCRTTSRTSISSCMEIFQAVREDCWQDTSQLMMGKVLFDHL